MPPAENNETPQYNLPPPIMESGPGDNEKAVDQAVASPEKAKNVNKPRPSNPRTQKTSFKLPSLPVITTPTVASTTSTSSSPQVADDGDLIEKEWVAKAKQIIEDNREDPYSQSKEITLFKADYMKKRYNKVIKVGE